MDAATSGEVVRCLWCDEPLSARDRRYQHGVCHECRSPKGKLADLDIAIRAKGDSPERIGADWKAIRHLLRQEFGDRHSNEELWERFTDCLQAGRISAQEYLGFEHKPVLVSLLLTEAKRNSEGVELPLEFDAAGKLRSPALPVVAAYYKYAKADPTNGETKTPPATAIADDDTKPAIEKRERKGQASKGASLSKGTDTFVKWKSFLLQHHNHGGDLNQTPATPTKIEQAGICSTAMSSRHFKKQWGGFKVYERHCDDLKRLEIELKLLAGEMSVNRIGTLITDLQDKRANNPADLISDD